MRVLFAIPLGFLAGAAFGAAFGALASVFEGGPPPLVGVAESWWWFALVGAGIAFGAARASRAGRPPAPHFHP